MFCMTPGVYISSLLAHYAVGVVIDNKYDPIHNATNSMLDGRLVLL